MMNKNRKMNKNVINDQRQRGKLQIIRAIMKRIGQ